MSQSVIEWVGALPLQAAVGIGFTYFLIMAIRHYFRYLATKVSQNPEEALRADLMEAHREVRKEVQELRRELADTYDKMRNMTVELHRIREGLAAVKVELHLLKTEYPEGEAMFKKIIEKIDAVEVE